MQYIDLFSQRTVQLPSVSLFQKQELAVWRPAPFFCMIKHVTGGKRKDKRELVRRVSTSPDSDFSAHGEDSVI